MSNIVTISLPEHIINSEEIQKLRENSEFSKKIKELLVEHVIESDVAIQGKTLLQLANLSKKQEEIVKYLLDNKISKITKPKLVRRIRSKGIYNRVDYAKNALDMVAQNKFIPYKFEGDYLKFDVINCRCGTKTLPHKLKDQDFKCEHCGYKLVDMEGTNPDITVGE